MSEKIRLANRHMRLADESVHVPGGVEWEDNVELLVSVAHRCGVDAVWPVRLQP
jgi:biotin carboxylase